VGRSRPRAATGLGLPPSVLSVMIAIGQPSTDSIGARWRTNGTSGASTGAPDPKDEGPASA